MGWPRALVERHPHTPIRPLIRYGGREWTELSRLKAFSQSSVGPRRVLEGRIEGLGRNQGAWVLPGEVRESWGMVAVVPIYLDTAKRQSIY